MTISKKHLRPRLIVQSPIIFYISSGFAILNVCFGLSLIYASNKASFIVENSYITASIWGIIFILLGIAMAYGLIVNRNRIVRDVLIAGLCVKFIWWFAFIALAIKTGFFQTIAALGFWFFISMLQGVAILFFPPTEAEIRQEVSKRLSEITNAR